MNIKLLIMFLFVMSAGASAMDHPEYRVDINYWETCPVLKASMQWAGRVIVYISIGFKAAGPEIVGFGCDCNYDSTLREDASHCEITQIFLNNLGRTLKDLGYSTFVIPKEFSAKMPRCIYNLCTKIQDDQTLIPHFNHKAIS